MENASYARVRLESSPYSGTTGIGVLSGVYLVGLIACLGLGAIHGPNVFERVPHDGPEKVTSPSLNVTWFGRVTGMEPWHQVLFLHMKLLKPLEGGVEYEQRYNVSSWAALPLDEDDSRGESCEADRECVQLTHNKTTDKVIKCKKNDEWCGWTNLLTEEFVEYPQYYMKVDMVEPQAFKHLNSFELGFEMVFITKAFTQYQMAWHYMWATVTLLFMFLPKLGFFYEMLLLHQNFWSRQQVRVGILLAALFFFNNVFFAFQIFSRYPRFFFSLYIVLLATFLALILFFWLELFTDLAAGNMQGADTALEWERNRSKTLKEYLPKLVLVGLIWISTILVYIYVRVKQTGDPSYSTFDDLSTYTTVKASGLLLSVIYFVWLGILVERSLRHLGGMNPEYIFVMMITLVTIFGTMAAFFTGALAPDQHGSKVFAFFYGMFNLYVLLMAFCYTPAGMMYGDVSTTESVEMVAPAPKHDDGSDDAFTVVESSATHTML